jgi:hypothetical protein
MRPSWSVLSWELVLHPLRIRALQAVLVSKTTFQGTVRLALVLADASSWVDYSVEVLLALAAGLLAQLGLLVSWEEEVPRQKAHRRRALPLLRGLVLPVAFLRVQTMGRSL